ncbi:MAG: glycine cleavage system aminomethyltransferase GcvT [Candidatus Tyrphobacter sp.]
MNATGGRRTALFDEHMRLGARIVDFGGFEMPVSYAGVLKEHDAVRHRAGLFDLSHMGQFRMKGEAVAAWADTLTTNNVATMQPLQARYNLFCSEIGGTHDDTIFYRLPGDRWLLVVNASNAQKIWDLLRDRPPGVSLENRHGEDALVAVQGPQSVSMLQPHVDDDLAAMKYYTCLETEVEGVPALVARTGYTGEDGFEIFVDGAFASNLWNALLRAHAREGLQPCGLGARDVLRLEAGMPLYGHELTEEITPVAGGQAWAVKLKKPVFRGREALAQQIARDDFARVAGIVMQGRVPARQGYPVFAGARRVGEVCSGSFAPSVDGGTNVATALLEREAATIGTHLAVEIRGARHDARVVAMPFYKRSS